MRFEWTVARRYLWSKRRHPFVGVVALISMIGIGVGTAALITVLAVMNGFDGEMRDRIIGLRAHLVVEKDSEFPEWPALSPKIEAMGAASAPYVEGQALLQVDEWGTGILVRGVDPVREKKVSRFFQYVKEGSLTNRPDGVVLGSELARRSAVKVGQTVKIATQSMDKPAELVVEGIFTSGMFEYDANIAFVNLPAAQRFFGLGQGVTGISLYLKKPDAAEKFQKDLQARLHGPYHVRTWMDMNRTLFAALKLEKVVMFLILALIVLVACLNIAGSLTILVMDKTKDIGVLRALGAPASSILRVFALDGLILGVLGAAGGFAAGTGLCFLLKKYSFIELPKEVYYIERLPVKMDPSDTLWVLVVAVGLSFLSALYPAVMAGRLEPVKALRYE